MSRSRSRSRASSTPPSRSHPRQSPKGASGPSLILLGGILAAFLLHSLYYNGLIDDAFISFRYARNLAEGLGLVFNPGERVEGYTNLLWVLIVSTVIRLGADPVVWSRGIGIAAGAATLLLVHRLALRSRPDLPALALAAPLLLACNRTFCAWSTGGLETSFFSFLCVLALFLVGMAVREAFLLAGVALGLASLTRPEGVIVFGAVAIVLLWEGARSGEAAVDEAPPPSSVAVRLGLLSLPFFLLAGAQLAFRLHYYGRWVPNTYVVKVNGFYPASGLVHVALFARDNLLGPQIVGIVAAVASLQRPVTQPSARRTLLAGLLAPGFYLVYIFLIGGDHFEYRFFHPILALLAAPFAAGVVEIRDRLASNGNAARRAAAALTFLAAAQGVVVSIAGFQTIDRTVDLGFQKARVSITSVEFEQRFCRTFAYLGQWLFRHADPKETVTIGAVGSLPYYSRLRTVDILGLTEMDGASLPLVEGGAVGHQRMADREYVFRRGVTYYVVTPKMQLPGPDPLRLVRVSLPDGDYSFQSVAADAKIQPGQYSWP